MRAPQERLKELERQIKRQEASPIQKILFIMLFCFSVVIAGAYVSFLMGSRYFLIPLFSAEPDKTISDILCIAMFCANTFFVIYFSLNVPIKKAATLALCYSPFFLFFEKLPVGNELKTLVFPLLYTAICYATMDRTDIKKFLIRLAMINIAIPLYQIPTIAIKYNITSLAFQAQSVSIISKLFFSFDFYLFMVNIIMWKVVKQYELQLVVGTKDIENPILDNEDLESLRRFNSLRGFKKAKACIALVMFQVAQTVLVLFVCRVGNVLIEGSIVALASIVSGQYIKRRWHGTVLACTIVSTISTFIGARTPPNAKFSILIFVVIGISITYMLYRVTFLGDGSHSSDQKAPELTDREKRVLELKERGWKIEDIAAEIYVHRRTVDRILKSIKNKNSR